MELLSPVGDFECLKAAIQNGANAVYFGANLFNARTFAKNFDNDNLKKVIRYAKLRGVKTHLTLNTLIKENEIKDAFNLAKTAYEYGIDAIIVQDLGLSSLLIKNFPDIEIHGSTQMTIHNLEGVNKLQELGFKRVVLSRELSIPEIEYICKNSNIEIEIFAHGALCISYSGQCLMSSMIGARSGNRGKCAQPCRLPYELLDKNKKVLDKGYLLSPRDLCSLNYLPEILKIGVSSLKIEGRMKTPEYVATVTRIYRKYIDLAEKYISGKINEYIVEEKDKKDLLQVFNRGGFSSGHLLENSKDDLIFTKKPNHMGLYLGKIIKYNPTKGLITLKNLETKLSVKDTISFEKENSKYTVSEITKNNSNYIIGRMKGNLCVGDKVYKLSDKELSNLALNSFSKEYIKNSLDCKLDIQYNKDISVNIFCRNFNLGLNFIYEYKPQKAKNSPITKQNITNQFNKTLDTCFKFENIDINLEDNLFIPVSIINDIRRKAISKIQDKILLSFERKSNVKLDYEKKVSKTSFKPEISILLNILNDKFDYSKLKNIDKIYIPLDYFDKEKYNSIISILASKYKLYIYMPSIIKKDYIDNAKEILSAALSKFNIYGIVISNISELDILPNKNLDLIGNYTLNLYNSFTAKKLKDLGLHTATISPELDKDAICNLCDSSNIKNELIVYGNIPLMTINYCLDKNAYYLKDRIGLQFRILTDRTQSISTIYNSKITFISYSDFNVNSVRLDFLDENITKMNNIIYDVASGKRMGGNNFTNGNLNRII